MTGKVGYLVCDKCVNLEFICSKYRERIMWRVSIRCVWFISETNVPILLQGELQVCTLYVSVGRYAFRVIKLQYKFGFTLA